MHINHLKVIFVALLLAGCSEKPSELPAPSPGKPYQVRCIESLPEFTLGLDSKPTKAQEIALCSCIWQELGGWERKTSEKIFEGKESEISELHKRAFPARFGNALEKCGGMESS